MRRARLLTGWAITRIRQFYTRKVRAPLTVGRRQPHTELRAYTFSHLALGHSLQVKFTQQNWHDRLTTILDDFPKVRPLVYLAPGLVRLL